MKIETMDVLAFTITDVERLDPVRVMIENYEPGKGRITITCFGKAWTGAWSAMGGDTVQAFIKRVSNEYLIGYFDPQLESTVDDDNDENLIFVKSEIIKLRRQLEISHEEARSMWDEAENADDVKACCCDYLVGERLLGLFGDDPWYAKWPKVPNHEYTYLSRITDTVREALVKLEATKSNNIEALIATTKADIAKRKAIPEFGDSVDGNIQRLNAINETKASFSLENVEALIAALEREISIREQNLSIKLHMAARIAELEARQLCVKPSTLCVKLPGEIEDNGNPNDEYDFGYVSGCNAFREEAIKAIRAAGGTVEWSD